MKTKEVCMSALDNQEAMRFVNELWDDEILPRLAEYIRIPNKSPHFDPDWEKHGYMDDAVKLIVAWCERQNIQGLQVEVVRLPGRTPLIYIEIPGSSPATVVLYGHLDKQPEMSGWRAGFGPWRPVLEKDRLYGRGGADDGYAVFASLAAIGALQAQGVPHARCVVLIEASEESGSQDLPFYIDALATRIGEPDLVICLDSGAGNYEQLWCTTSLRGQVIGTLLVEILEEGVHSGNASGIVPSSFRILRQLLARLDDPETGKVLLQELEAEIPEQRYQQAVQAAQAMGAAIYQQFPFVAGARPVSEEPLELILNRTWRAALSVTGMDGIPPAGNAGNVLRPRTLAKLSMRLPPTCNAKAAGQAMRRVLETDPPYQAHVVFKGEVTNSGWNASPTAAWLDRAIQQASQAYFGKPAVYTGEGVSIPFVGMLGSRFPNAQFMVSGVLGPQSNAHGPNEFLHIPTAKRLTASVAEVIAAHYLQLSATKTS